MSAAVKGERKKETKLGMSTSKSENFGDWYVEILKKAELISNYDVSGCYILRPNAYRVWEKVQEFFDGEIKKLGVEPCYFPMFLSKKNLQKEEDHLEDFAPEVAWVTHSGTTKLEEPLAIRPTSETIMYPAFADWIQSHRDLPLRLNQWTNVVRWEFKNPTPFLRTREFLWQEGHTAFASRDAADEEVIQILDLYARVYEELFALPVVKGRKSCKEKFPGGDFTTTVEAFVVATGRSVQAGTSHSLGQNFSKMFNIQFLNHESKHEFAWQNSWGLSTRSIGTLVAVHGDDIGLVMPPRVAHIQVIGVAILQKDAEVNAGMAAAMDQLQKDCENLGVRFKIDDRLEKNPGWKFSYWEQRGVPLRVEIGPKDLELGVCVLVRRDNGAKESNVPLADAPARIKDLMEIIQADMLAKARRQRDQALKVAWTWDEFVKHISAGYLVLTPWCLTTDSEEWVKEETKRIAEENNAKFKVEGSNDIDAKGETKALTGAAKTLCLPFIQPVMPEGTPCFTGNGLEAVEWCMWGRSF